jgi:exopolyphosphatase / guanosine-5'-triphosphate,3'-diphosphate pyrophosphatase
MIAVIDCGTNTFNLLIAKLSELKTIEIIYSGKIPVKLGEGGIDKNTISEAAFERGIKALRSFKQTISSFDVKKTLATGTAAIRDAQNGPDFIKKCQSLTGINIELIDGNREAELIWLAAKTCIQTKNKFLVMDIGGGSNEFVIADHEKIYWKKSYRLGLSRLKETFALENDNSPKKLLLVFNLLRTAMADLFEACHEHKIELLVGTAGTFDTYANVFTLEETGKEFDFSQKTYAFDTLLLRKFCDKLIGLPITERNSIAGIPDFRKEFMIYACLLTKVVLENCMIKECALSSYALKEGLFLEEFNNSK